MPRIAAFAVMTATFIVTLPAAEAPRHTIAANATTTADLEFLRPLLANTRVVQLGEAGHGMRESNEIKVRLTRFLVDELGFRVVAFESSAYLAFEADRRAAEAGAQATLIAGVLGVWHTEELLPLFSSIASREVSRPHLAGFDVQPIGSNKRRRPQFFRDLIVEIDPAYAADVEAFDRRFIDEYDKGPAARRQYFRTSRSSLIDGYTRLADYLRRHEKAIAGRHGRDAAVIGRQEARSMLAYIQSQTIDDARSSAEARDRGMAENLRAIADERFPNDKVVVWGHNYHLQYANAHIPPQAEVYPGVTARSMGSWVKDLFGSRVYTIAVYPLEGRAVDNARAEYRIARAAPDSMEQRAAGSLTDTVFVDLAALERAGEAWVRSPQSARYNGQFLQRLVPRQQVDALVILRSVSPPRFLY